MAELATIARPYAEALFKTSRSHGQDASAWLAPLAAVAANAQLLQYADNPKTTSAEVFALMSGVMQQPLPEPGKNFLMAVIENGRLSALPEIAAQYRLLSNAVGGTSDAQVFSAFPIDAAALAELGAVLERRFGRKLHLSVTIEPDLIGGVRVVVGDEVLDTSVQARLQQMKVALTA